MGRIGRALRLVDDVQQLALTSLSSPWVTGSLEPIVWADVFGTDWAGPITRDAAMSVPAMARARHLLCSAVARSPIHRYVGADLAPSDPRWLVRTDGMVSPFHRMLWTVDDLLFTGWSLWAVERNADGFPGRADRVPPGTWQFSTNGRAVQIDNTEVDPSTYLLIPGPHEGTLTFAGRTLRTAAELEGAVAIAARSPLPAVDLHQTTDVELDQTEIDALVSRWVDARRGANGGVGYTNSAVEARVLGSHSEHLLIEGRNASAVDVARVAGIPAAMIDATNAGASLTYETTAGRNAEFLDYGVLPYMLAISSRLSQDDVVPAGSRVAFDTSELTGPLPTATGPTTED